MNTLDDWPRVKRVLEEALAREGPRREAYLAEVCGADEALRARVDRLLAAGDHVETFLETPAALLLTTPLREDLSGRDVSSYHLISRIAAGGMGEVYLAHDTKLDRPVALKFLSPEVAADHDRLRRFHQEARAASSLNHPHIVVIHDFGELDGRPYIVTEFIEGETLRDRLRRGPLPIGDVIDIGIQLAGALAAAHARGVVHRDIKPENVMVRPDGYAKVLDFGVAKIAPARPSPDHADVADVESRTKAGMVIGTPRYMSPEQALGLELDARTDVWSLGLVLYEMATGRLPIRDGGGVMPDAHAERDLPPELLEIIGKALQPVRDSRYQSAVELAADLKQIPRATQFPDPSPQPSPRKRGEGVGYPRPWKGRGQGEGYGPLAAIVAVALSSLALYMFFPLMRGAPPTDPPLQKSVAVLPFDNVTGDGAIDYLRLALADEIATALSGTPSLAVRPIASSRRFLGGGVSPQQAGQQLHAAGIVTGHFSRQQSELRVTVEAVDVDGNRLLWRDTIAAPIDDAIVLRDRLMARVRDGLLPALGAGAPAATRNRPRNAEAYAAYLKSLASSTDPQPNRDAIAMLQRATAIDPEHADTWVSLSHRHYYDAHYGGGGRDALRRSEAAAHQALALDPNRTTAAVRLLNIQVEAGRLQDGYDSAIKLVAQRPDSGEARFALSYVLRYGGLIEESARECEEAVSRDPANPQFRTCAQPFMLIGAYDRALDFVRLDTGSEWGRLVTRLIYQRMGRRSAARDQHERLAPEYLRGLAPDSFYGLLTKCLAGPRPDRQGSQRPAPERQGQLSDEDVNTFLTVREDPEPLYFWASDLAYCGYTEPAVRLLHESIRRNFCAVSAIESDPTFASLRQSADYSELVASARACRDRFREHVSARRAASP